MSSRASLSPSFFGYSSYRTPPTTVSQPNSSAINSNRAERTPSPQPMGHAPSSDLIFEFSPSLGRQIAESRGPMPAGEISTSPAQQAARAAGQRLQDALRGSVQAPMRALGPQFSFGSSSATTNASTTQDSPQMGLRASAKFDNDSLAPASSPEREGFTLNRWLNTDSSAPTRRPSTPRPPTDRSAGSESDSESVQAPSVFANKRQRRQ